MTICACIKSNGQQCTRVVSMKKDTNHNFCWQHQNCNNIKSISIIKSPKDESKKDTTTSLKIFKVDSPLIVGTYKHLLYALYTKDETDLPKINLTHGNYNLKSEGIEDSYSGFRIFYHNSIDTKTIDNLVEQIKLHNTIDRSHKWHFNYYGEKSHWHTLSSVMEPVGIPHEEIKKITFQKSKMIIMKMDHYNLLKDTPVGDIINIIVPEPISKDTCYMDNKQIICQGWHNQDVVMVDHKILIFYDPDYSQYKKKYLASDDGKHFYKPHNYDSIIAKEDYIEQISEKMNMYEIAKTLDIDIADMVNEKLNDLDMDELKKLFPMK